jgi:hypothetical protein
MMATMHREFPAVEVRSRARWWLGGFVLAVTLPVAVFSGSLLWLPSSVRYTVTEDRLTVVTRTGLLSGDRSVRRADVERASLATVRGGRRTNGTAMPGHCTGSFRFADIGDAWAAGNCSPEVVVVRVRGDARPLILTPPDRQAFVAALLTGTPMTVEPAPVEAPPNWWLFKLLALTPLATVVIGPGIFALSSARLGYAVGDGELEVRTAFARRRISLRGATARPYRPRRLARIAGSNLPGYNTGFFRGEEGTVRVYASTVEEGVLIEGRRRVFVSPADRAGFLDALRTAGTLVET